ncbi:flagellar basal body-associated FliL family protein [Scopulibacillus cellulosilyticus]|uniref:Flagellar protein FliL n=1 Tax=Scopulibacillus cellulosilyticus TaxID=2665665 RepID=A0ABW2PV57_9BACL
MFRSRGLKIFFIVVFSVIVIGLAGYLWFYFMDSNKIGSAKDKNNDIKYIIKNLTVDTDEITTNLKDDHYIKVQFKIQVSNKDAKKELTDREFQVKNAIIYILSGMTPRDLQGPKGLTRLENLIKSKINQDLESGQVTHVYTTEKIIQ